MQAVITRPCPHPTSCRRQNKQNFKVFGLASNASQKQQPSKQSIQVSTNALNKADHNTLCWSLNLKIKRIVETSGRTTRQYGAAAGNKGSSSTNGSSTSQFGVGDLQQNAVDLLKGKTMLNLFRTQLMHTAQL